MGSIGEQLVAELEQRGVDTVFGIPGVHTLELYRGLAASGIRHVTPRHEQGAGFMADGFARASGKPGVAFVITGPGLTNTLTAMAQARADSVPMVVISGVNPLPTLGKGMGHLHELPDQQRLAGSVALRSERVETAADLVPALNRAFDTCLGGRPGPVHIEVPLDLAGEPYTLNHEPGKALATRQGQPSRLKLSKDQLDDAAARLSGAQRPVILAGGGVRLAGATVRTLARRLDAPVVQTINARGLLFDHALSVPASPSLQAVRDLIEAADVVLALGTELGSTDYDMYATGTLALMRTLIRVDICAQQLSRHPATLPLQADASATVEALLDRVQSSANDASGAARAQQARERAFDEIGANMRALSHWLNAIRDAIPSALIVGDSAQPLYAGNLAYDHDRPGGWFNAATGFGALGYAIPAAIGAAVARPDVPVVCITGDGGAQFSLPELMVARDENLPIVFIVWNNHGYQEIDTSMKAAGITAVGCAPSPPDFGAIAAACRMRFHRCGPSPEALVAALALTRTEAPGPVILEIDAS